METNPISLHVRAHSTEIARHREAVARNVIGCFGERFSLPEEWRVVCLLDDEDFYELKLRAGKANRGIHLRLKDAPLCGLVPQHFWDVVRPYDAAIGKCLSPFDSLVYLHGGTCEEDIGLTFTLAHELRHVFQYATRPKIWAANILLQNLPDPFSLDFTVWWDFPIERDARVAAKSIAEALFGSVSVRQYITGKIESPVTEDDAKDWEFLLSIDTAESFDYSEQTHLLVKKYREPLMEARRQRSEEFPVFAEINFDSEEWHI